MNSPFCEIPLNKSNKERDLDIFNAVQRGISYSKLAKKYNVSSERITRINQKIELVESFKLKQEYLKYLLEIDFEGAINSDISLLGVPERDLSALNDAGVKRIGDLTNKTSRDLICMPSINTGAIRRIEESLAASGLALTQEIPKKER